MLFSKYDFKLGQITNEDNRNNNFALEGSVSKRISQWWFEKIFSGDQNFKNEPQGRSKSILNKGQLKTKMKADSQTTICDLAADLEVSAVTGKV